MPGSKPSLSVSFHNFWRGFEPASSFFTKALRDSYDVNIVAEGDDVQISSSFGSQRLPDPRPGKRALRVWYTGEARDPQSQLFDMYFGFRPSASLFGNRWHRYPIWVLYIDWWDPTSHAHIDKLTSRPPVVARPNFCNFIYSAPAATRGEFFLRLDGARPVDSLGKVLNNRDGRKAPGSAGKMKALSDSTFTVAFENQISPGYVTEKLVEPLMAGSIPIYWGAQEARTDFNPDAFIFADDVGTFDDLVAHVLRLSDSKDALATMASAPAFKGNRVTYEHRPEYFVDRVREALSGSPDALLPRRLLQASFDPDEERSAKYRLRRLRDRLLRSRLPRK